MGVVLATPLVLAEPLARRGRGRELRCNAEQGVRLQQKKAASEGVEIPNAIPCGSRSDLRGLHTEGDSTSSGIGDHA